MKHKIHLSCKRENGHAVSAVSLNDGDIVSGANVPLSEQDAERMATLICVEKLLALSKGRAAQAIIPSYVRAALWTVQQILAAKHKAILQGKKSSPDLEKILATARTSPSKVIRAAAAAATEFLR